MPFASLWPRLCWYSDVIQNVFVHQTQHGDTRQISLITETTGGKAVGYWSAQKDPLGDVLSMTLVLSLLGSMQRRVSDRRAACSRQLNEGKVGQRNLNPLGKVMQAYRRAASQYSLAELTSLSLPPPTPCPSRDRVHSAVSCVPFSRGIHIQFTFLKTCQDSRNSPPPSITDQALIRDLLIAPRLILFRQCRQTLLEQR